MGGKCRDGQVLRTARLSTAPASRRPSAGRCNGPCASTSRAAYPSPDRHQDAHEVMGGLGNEMLDVACEVEHGQAKAGTEHYEFGRERKLLVLLHHGGGGRLGVGPETERCQAGSSGQLPWLVYCCVFKNWQAEVGLRSCTGSGRRSACRPAAVDRHRRGA